MSKQTKIIQEQDTKPEKEFLGVFIERELKGELKEIARLERRSMSAQVELFLSLGVLHLKEKQAA